MGTRNFILPDKPLDIPDPESVRDEATREKLGTPSASQRSDTKEKRSELSGASEASFNSSSVQQPLETADQGTAKEFARQATAWRKPTNDVDREDYDYQ